MSIDRERYPYKMKDLSELSGLDRQTIHFYIQEGLVPEGIKTSRNMAYYGPEHVERLSLVRELAQERFLPLKAIRAFIEGRVDSFSPEQRALLVGVGERLLPTLAPAAARERFDAGWLCAQHGVELAELEQMRELGLLSLVHSDGSTEVAAQDVWIVELWGQFREAGFTSDLGFEVGDLTTFAESVRGIFDHETTFFTSRIEALPAADVAALVQRGLPLINLFLARYHLSLAREFFSAIRPTQITTKKEKDHADR